MQARDFRSVIRQHRFLILLAIGLVGLLLLRATLPSRITDVAIEPRGMQTNSSGILCLRVAITNKSSIKTYGIGFATQAKAAGGWDAPSLIKHFNICAQTLLPSSASEALVPVPQTRTPWRVAALYFEHDQIPRDSLGRMWRELRFRMGHFRKFLTTPDISSPPGGRTGRRGFVAVDNVRPLI